MHDDLSGKFNTEHFETSYAFLQERETSEIENLKKRIEARLATGARGRRLRKRYNNNDEDFYSKSLEDDEEELKYMQRNKALREKNQLRRTAKQKVKRQTHEDIVNGKRKSGYHLKRSEKKRLQLEAEFDELKKKGGTVAVNRELAKRRKKMLPRIDVCCKSNTT